MHEPEGWMQFEVFEKHISANYFQIEQKFYDCFLINYIHNKITEQIPLWKWHRCAHSTKTFQQVLCRQNKRFGCFLPNPIVL